jgi:hypothetical protein
VLVAAVPGRELRLRLLLVLSMCESASDVAFARQSQIQLHTTMDTIIILLAATALFGIPVLLSFYGKQSSDSSDPETSKRESREHKKKQP